jgi:hypothetical protein
MVVHCRHCGFGNSFDQPYPFHAGFSNQGFLYNEAGDLTLVWSSFDPAYERIVGNKHPWMLDTNDRGRLEAELLPSPRGDRWLFSNPARCGSCGQSIAAPMIDDIYYVRYAGSVDTDQVSGKGTFCSVLRVGAG